MGVFQWLPDQRSPLGDERPQPPQAPIPCSHPVPSFPAGQTFWTEFPSCTQWGRAPALPRRVTLGLTQPPWVLGPHL